MYRSKALGGNQFQLYTSALQEKCVVRLDQESELHRALMQQEFFLEYQLQYDIKDRQLIGVEAPHSLATSATWGFITYGFYTSCGRNLPDLPIGEWIINTTNVLDSITELKNLGVNIVLDDFGT